MSFLQRLPRPSQLGLMAVIGSGALLGGALFFQYVGGLAPCEMCFWQRYPHMVAIAAGLSAVAAYRWPRAALALPITAIVALIVTAGLGVFHSGVEQRWWQGPQSCTGRIPSGLTIEQLKKYLAAMPLVRCDQIPWSLIGISMAGWNAILSAGLAFAMSIGVTRYLRARP